MNKMYLEKLKRDRAESLAIFRGLLIALPVSLLLWAAIISIVAWIIQR